MRRSSAFPIATIVKSRGAAFAGIASSTTAKPTSAVRVTAAFCPTLGIADLVF
jgi:hypothetical protein